MREIQYDPVITLDDFQAFTERSRRHDEGEVTDWDTTYAELITGEGLEFLVQHGNGAMLLLPEVLHCPAEPETVNKLSKDMADELSDLLWFSSAVATHRGNSIGALSAMALRRHTGTSIDTPATFATMQTEVTEHAQQITVANKLGLYMPDAPVERRHTSLPDNTYYVFLRTHHRLTRALERGENDSSPPTATEMEPLHDIDLALGDFINVITYVAKQNLGWDIEDIARYNAHKLKHRKLFGKGVPTP